MSDARRSAGETIRVLIVDDHAVVRQGLRTFLELQDNPAEMPIEVAAEAANGLQAVALAGQIQPELILLDLVMPEMDGIQAAARIREVSPRSRILILTSFGEEDRVVPAIQAGAQGYLLKDIAPQKLVEAIRSACRGEVQLHPSAARQLVAAVSHKEAESAPLPRSAGELTEREGEIIRLIASGMSNRQIAEQLVISEKTVKTHVSSILSKLGLEDRTQAAIYALKHGLAADRD